MKRHLLTGFLVFALAGCGGDDSEPVGSLALPPNQQVPTEVGQLDLGEGLVAPLSRGVFNEDEVVVVLAKTPVGGVITGPSSVGVSPENDQLLVVDFVGGDWNCQAALVNVTETNQSVGVELVVGTTPDVASQACATGDFSLRIETPLSAPLGDRTLETLLRSDDQSSGVFDLPDLLGLTRSEAVELVQSSGQGFRVAEPGELATSNAYESGRLELVTDSSGVVIAVEIG